MLSVGCNDPVQHRPGNVIFGFHDDGSFGEKAATCLFMESVCAEWPPNERIALEAVLLTPCSRLDLQVRVWSNRPNDGGAFGDPDWKTTKQQKDQQGIPAYALSLRIGLLGALKNFFRELSGGAALGKTGGVAPEDEKGRKRLTWIMRLNEMKCRFGLHSWEGCKCSRCPETRDKGHDWSSSCVKCARCGKQRFESQGPAICCSRCGKKYMIGQDAGIMSFEATYDLVGKTIVISGDTIWQHEDLVFSLVDVAPSDLEKARNEARANCQAILDVKNEYQSRVWRCRMCGSVNAYRINGMTFFYENRLSGLLSREQLEKADYVLRVFGTVERDTIASSRLAEEILHDIVITRLDVQKRKAIGIEPFCSYQNADGAQDVGFLSVGAEFRAEVRDEWVASLKSRGQQDINKLYTAGQVEELLDNSLFAIAGRIPDYFIVEDWNSAGVFRIAPVVPEVNYGKINWDQMLRDDSGFCARARMIWAHITKLSEQGKIEVFLNKHPIIRIDDILYFASLV